MTERKQHDVAIRTLAVLVLLVGILYCLIPSRLQSAFASYPLGYFSEQVASSTLAPRELENVQNNDINAIDCYLEKVLDGPLVSLALSGRWPDSTYRSFGRSAFRIGTPSRSVDVTGLRGCTVAIAVSQVGVWIGHWWEVPGFTTGDNFPRLMFEEEVVYHIKNGIALKFYDKPGDNEPSKPPRGDKLSDKKDKLKDASIWILGPAKDGTKTSFLYADEMEVVKKTLEGEIDGKVSFHDLYYLRPDDGEVMPIMFEYDPKPQGRVRFMYGNHPVGFDGVPGKVGK